MVHYAGINRTTSNAEGQNNILGHAIHSVTLKCKKKKKSKQKSTKTNKGQKIGEIFPGKSLFFMYSYFWASKNLANSNSSTFCNLSWRRILCRRLICLKELQIHSPASKLDFWEWSLPVSAGFSSDGGEIPDYPINSQTLCALGPELRQHFSIPAEPKGFIWRE